jgi:hypothetical protein
VKAMRAPAAAARLDLDLGDLRWAGGLMLGVAAIRPVDSHLGLPCPLRTLTGIPCPLCGMTTSVTDVVHLHVRAGLGANPAGLVAVLIALVLLAVPRVRHVTVPTWVIPAGLAAMWLFELARFHII